jgi:hypothetical protein
MQHLNGLFQMEGLSAPHFQLAENGDVLIIGAEFPSSPNFKHFFARIDGAGNLRWKKHYAFLHDFLGVSKLQPTPDGGFIVALGSPLSFRLDLLKMDEDGNVFPNQLIGQLAIDDNVNCLIDATEQTLANWKIQLISPSYNLYTNTDSSGAL